MDALVRASLLVRRLVREGWSALLVLALAVFVVGGGTLGEPSAAQAVALLAFVVVLARRGRHKLRRLGDAPWFVDVELGALLATLLDGLMLRFEGTLSGSMQPASYVLVALVAAFARPAAAIGVVAFMLGLDTIVRAALLGEPPLASVATHGGFVAAFALLQLASIRTEIARIRATATRQLEGELTRLRDDARSYRLLGGSGAGEGREGKKGEVQEDRLARSGVEEIHQSVHYALDILRRSLDLHTAVLLWRNDAGTHLRISELSTSSEDVHDAPFSVGDGVLAAVVTRKEPVALENLKASFKLPYYAGGCPVRALLAIPVLEDGHVRGILALDRQENAAFSPREQELAAQAARFCLRAIQNERVFIQVERAKAEQGKLYRAAQALGSSLTEKDVVEAGVRAAREIASFELAAVTIWDEATKTHEVVAAKSEGGKIDELVGARFRHNAGLVSMVVANRFPLPYRGEYDPAHQLVLTKRYPWPDLPSLLVLPLVAHDKVLGTLILGARRRHAFGDAVRPTLEVLASHLAVSLSHARMVHKLETMATTDGLTGLLNKRAMLDAAAQKIASADRFGRKLSVLVTDIDFFKKVNDTYGHDVGDVVIKGLGAILEKNKRTTDAVARFGGEEFVVLCEETDEEGARLLAERVREELKATSFPSPLGPLSVTCSIGVATFPGAGGTWDELFKAADEALYVSKRGGRDRVSVHVVRGRESEARALAPKASGPALPGRKKTG